MKLFEEGGDVESVDEEGLSACAFCMREKMEELKAARISLYICLVRLKL